MDFKNDRNPDTDAPFLTSDRKWFVLDFILT